ncbi:MAG TPA: DUF4911 domain-containing protein [Polyangiaceae bacterium]
MPSAKPMIGEGLVARAVRVMAKDVVFVKGLIEAHEGVAVVFAEKGGDLTICAPTSLEPMLDQIVEDLCAEVGAMKITPPEG